ncbi:hypothetical protein [Dasineura jujubifolia toursvirus 2a]|nr:hypothetical protein [Dasineura jujubifolia toursvirus 2a]
MTEHIHKIVYKPLMVDASTNTTNYFENVMHSLKENSYWTSETITYLDMIKQWIYIGDNFSFKGKYKFLFSSGGKSSEQFKSNECQLCGHYAEKLECVLNIKTFKTLNVGNKCGTKFKTGRGCCVICNVFIYDSKEDINKNNINDICCEFCFNNNNNFIVSDKTVFETTLNDTPLNDTPLNITFKDAKNSNITKNNIENYEFYFLLNTKNILLTHLQLYSHIKKWFKKYQHKNITKIYSFYLILLMYNKKIMI